MKPTTGKGKPIRTTLALEVDESRELLSYAAGTRMHTPVMLAEATGMRAGEVLALAWDAVDLVNAEVRVERAWEEVGGVLALKEPKSAKGKRTIPLPPWAVDELARLKDEYEVRRREVDKIAGKGAYDMEYGPLVVCDDIGRQWRPGSFASRYIVFRADALARWTADHSEDDPQPDPPKWARARYHDLRRSAGSQLLVAGVAPKVVSEWLGHFSVAFTMDVYCDVLDSLEQESRRLMGDMWAQAGATPGNLGDKSGANCSDTTHAASE